MPELSRERDGIGHKKIEKRLTHRNPARELRWAGKGTL